MQSQFQAGAARCIQLFVMLTGCRLDALACSVCLWRQQAALAKNGSGFLLLSYLCNSSRQPMTELACTYPAYYAK
jgi:hypothetical protein